LAREAFNINPLVENGDNAIKVLHELFVAHEKYLPQFAECIKTLKTQGLKPSDETVCKLLAEGK
jgi:6-phospho-beta-glucosidase